MKSQPRLKQKYRDEVCAQMMDKFQYKSVMQLPKLEKIKLNMGVGAAIKESKILDAAVEELALISGQKPTVSKARKSVSNFKLREGMNIGAHVTLRNENMYEFLDRFISITAARIKDFQGLSTKSFDGRGNYNFGVTEQTVFCEIKFDSVIHTNGLNITIVTSAKTDEEGLELLKAMGFPFKKNN